MSADINPKLKPYLTPWYEAEQHGQPIREGVYRGSAIGNDEGSLNLGYYYWDKVKWTGLGNSPAESEKLKGKKNFVFSVNNWQGLTKTFG